MARVAMPPAPPLAFASSAPLGAADLTADGGPRFPRPSRLAAPLEVAPAPAAKGAERLGLHTVGDLLEHLPRDRSEARTVGQLVPGETATVVVEVRAITSRPVRRRGMRPLVEATVADASGPMKATFFNQPWLERKYRPGTRLMLHGKYEARNRFRVQQHAPTSEQTGAEGEVATYPATEGLSSTQLAALMVEHRPALADVVEPLPARLRAAGRWPDRAAALDAAHFGEHEAGRLRLAFEELLLLQLVLLRRRALRHEGARAEPLAAAGTLTARWLAESLPFAPTGDQERAMRAIDRDLAAGRPMQRLLMGEVGSGKTVVALYAMLRAVEQGAQAALMAPTETLAEQHFATLQTLMPGELVQAALLTGSTTASRRADLLGKLASGELKLLVGTHALIEEAVSFDRLAVAVVDEQHRFGVNQRRALDRKAPAGLAPHVLHMTATPIPRTLALTAYGDLDVTVLRELPAGRRPIDTHVASTERERARAYERIREELREGRQAFVVCPLVEESEALQARAATAEYERLARTEFKDFRVELLHGQLQVARQAAGDGGVRRRGRRRARGHDGDRGGDRRPERLRDARRGRRALRHLASCTSSAGASAAARTIRSACSSAPRSRRACAPWPSTATASSWPRSTSSCAARGRCSARASRGSRSSAWRGCRRTPRCSRPRGRSGPRCSRATRTSPGPSTRCSSWPCAPRTAATRSIRSRPNRPRAARAARRPSPGRRGTA